MDQLVEILSHVRKRPGMYWGSAGPSISHLRTFISGAMIGHVDCGVLDAFQPWLCHRYGVCLSGTGWNGLILERAGGDEAAAFRIFFELFDEYLDDRKSIGAEVIKLRYDDFEKSQWKKIQSG